MVTSQQALQVSARLVYSLPVFLNGITFGGAAAASSMALEAASRASRTGSMLNLAYTCVLAGFWCPEALLILFAVVPFILGRAILSVRWNGKVVDT